MNRLFLGLLFLALLPVLGADPSARGQIHEVRSRKNTSLTDMIFTIDQTEIRDTDTLRAFVEKLPAGSTLRWDSGCNLYRTIPLRGPEVKLSEFRAFCKERSIIFDFVCGY